MKSKTPPLCVVLVLLLSLVTACGPEPTQAPTGTPAPTPTLGPRDPSSLEPPEDLDSFVFSETLLWEGTTPSGREASYHSSTVLEYVDDPRAMHLTRSGNDPDMGMILDFAGVKGDSVEVYFLEDMMCFPIWGSTTLVSLDVPRSLMDPTAFLLDPEHLTLGHAYTLTQWLDAAEAVGHETYGGVEVEHYSFDETALNLRRLPAGMGVQEASGNLYVTVAGGHLLHMDMTLRGTGLALAAVPLVPLLSEGTLKYTSDLSSINEAVPIELPEDVVQATSLPEDIPLPADASQWIASHAMGEQSFMFASDSSPSDIADFYRAEMPENGWVEFSIEEEAGFFVLEYNQDDRSVELQIGTYEDTGETYISIRAGVEDTAHARREMRVADLSLRQLTLPPSGNNSGHAMCECVLRLPSLEFSS